MRQFAGGDCAVVDQVLIGTGFIDNFSRKCKGSGRSQDYPVGAKLHAGRPGHIVEAAGFERQIVCGVRCANVVVVRSAVEGEVSGCGHLFGIRVEGCFVGPQHIIIVVDFNRPVQLVNGTLFFLLNGADSVYIPVFLLRRGRQSTGRWLSGRRLSGGRLFQRRGGVHRRQLAGY